MTSANTDNRNYLNVDYRFRSWLWTTDHKRIAVLYMISVTFFFFIGGAAAVLFRLELMTPRGDLVIAETYNKLFTLHGVIMVFFFLIPSIPAVLGNFLLPMMIGARDLAFPKLNLASWYIFMLGGFLAIGAIIAGGADTGWTFYTPYSSTYANTNVILMALGIFVAGFSSILTGLNFIVTTHSMRAPGLTWFRLPLFVWSLYATSLIMVLGTPVIAITLLLVALERGLGIGIFDPKIGGDPLLFQHLFWFYSHPAVYIMILPSMGVVSEIVACFARNRIFGYTFVAFASLAIAVLGFLVWGHHMFVSGQSIYAGMVFSLLSMLVAVPSAVKVFNWTATLYRGAVWLATPMLYALGFIGLFTLGGLTGLFLATLAVDVHVHDTYFVIAHFHYIMVGGAVMGYLGGIHFWWPKMTGRMYSEWWGRLSAGVIFIGFNLTFFPQFVLGYLGMPRRVHEYVDQFQVLNVMSSAGASILGAGYLIPLAYLLWSLRYGPHAGDNPWHATGLEWQTASPPPPFNFLKTPIVEHEAYDYEADRPVPDQNFEPDLASREAPHIMSNAVEHRVSVAHHFDDAEQQYEAAGLGMWLFLATEVLFFGGLFAGYAQYRYWYLDAFVAGSHRLDLVLGALNTAVLLTSSLTMALAVRAAQTNDHSGIVRFLGLTILLGSVFLGVKAYEYYHKFEERLIPGPNFAVVAGHDKNDEARMTNDESSAGQHSSLNLGHVELFFSSYFALTGLHATHMIIGIVILGVLLVLAHRGIFSAAYFTPVEMTGLYWHFVDIVWVFLFPLLYLIR